MKAAQKIKSALALIGLLALGILTGALLLRKPEKEKSDEAEKAKEEKKNEIEGTPAGSLVSAAGNADELRAEKNRIRADFRERIRNRLGEELHRLSGSGDDSDCGAGGGAINR
ncbi:hypothetical protein [uncultured Treponema sp.]|uniref:hypothetical protein n=1 Tax=uncultured Treponema sp. TaxID=162155 RepID=UPI00258D74BB|nr:hypothetical protein [uncultured Treponema sp.]